MHRLTYFTELRFAFRLVSFDPLVPSGQMSLKIGIPVWPLKQCVLKASISMISTSLPQ
jgi:hypothetical protein